ncbi:MAG: gluconate 2-dehydrogenase subunit 3 family protein [Gammaproteobacteria bacterium]|nr:gluconate 2-dehydrogenase subunit 3 family protein [Gammaproteobacteria bacterium]
MSFTRRAFIKLLSLGLLLRYPSAVFAGPGLQDHEKTLAAFLDTLMPADETPAASELRIDQTLLQKSDGDERYRRLLRNGCLWLERTARRKYQSDFTALTGRQRVRIVELMEQARPRTIARVFFHRVRTDLFEHYYSHPESWKGLDIDRPPQPKGYPDYDQPPAAHS